MKYLMDRSGCYCIGMVLSTGVIGAIRGEIFHSVEIIPIICLPEGEISEVRFNGINSLNGS